MATSYAAFHNLRPTEPWRATRRTSGQVKTVAGQRRCTFRPEVQLNSIHIKVRYLIVSRAIMLMADSDYRLHQYDPAKGHLEFRHRQSAKEPALLFVIDDQSEPTDTTFTRLQNAEVYARARGAIVAAFVAAPTRIARLSVLCEHHSPNSKVIDIWGFGRRTEPS
jgi:hypothetical protein